MTDSKKHIGEGLKDERRKSIERYLDLYLEGCITKDELLDALTE